MIEGPRRGTPDNGHTPRRFLLLSTGQNVANLPPLLAVARTDDDVVWLESDRAHDQAWTDGANAVLVERGFHPQRLRCGDAPGGLRAALRDCLPVWATEGLLILVGNGGSKLQSMELWDALAGSNAGYLYGQDRPTQALERDAHGDFVVHSYGTEALTLAEILRCTGHVITGGSGNLLDADAVLPTPSIQGYGVDAAATLAAHDATESWNQLLAAASAEDFPAFATLQSVVAPERLAKWLLVAYNNSHVLRGHLSDVDWNNARVIWQRIWRRPGAAGSIYHATLNLARAARNDALRADHPDIPRGLRIGESLEAAVAHRVVAWLLGEGSACRSAVSAVHTGVRVATLANTGKTTAEFDVLLVLRNGILVNLECKSYDARSKDLDARGENLHRAGSQLARMVVVAPQYTAARNRRWFAISMDLLDDVRARGVMGALAFDLPGQPPECVYDKPDGTQASITVPPFEHGLERLLRPYLPEVGG